MGWKDWPYWLKGGIIAISIYVIITVILIPVGQSNGGWPNLPAWTLPSMMGLIPVTLLIWLGLNNASGPYIIYLITILSIIFSIIIYFLIGSLIGWIVGKFKSKNVQ